MENKQIKNVFEQIIYLAAAIVFIVLIRKLYFFLINLV